MAANNSDMMKTFELIKNFWPELQFRKEDFLKGNPEFIKGFYQAFLAELNDKIAFLSNEEEIYDEFGDIQGFDEPVVLYCKAVKIFKKLQIVNINLGDFYCINPKKMYSYLKCCMHLLIYINNYVDEISNMVNENLKKLSNAENFAVLKEQFLQGNAENAVELAKLLKLREDMNQTLEELENAREKMLEDKAVDDKLMAENRAHVKELQNETDNLEYELKLLEEKENYLKECLITGDEYEKLKNTAKNLEIEDQRISTDNLDDNVDIDKNLETIKRLEEFSKQLGEINLESLDVEGVHQLRQELGENQNIHKKYEQKLADVNNVLEEHKTKLQEMEATLQKAESILDQFKRKFLSEEKEAQRKYETKAAQCSADFEESQRLRTEFICEEEEIQKIEEEERTLKSAVAQEYNRILKMDTATTQKFYNVMQKILKPEK